MRKSAPYLAWRTTPLGHVFGRTRLCDLKPKLEQLAMNARRTPQRIFDAHLPYQRTQLCLNLRSPSSAPGFPTPTTTKASPVPMHQGLGTNDCEYLRD
jgi:hypothetical protein